MTIYTMKYIPRTPLLNTVKDGSGTFYLAGCDDNGREKVTPQPSFFQDAIRQGLGFKVTDYATGISSGGTKDWLIVTPNSQSTDDTVITVASNLAGVLQVYEAATTSAAGTAHTVYNANRNSAITASTTFSDGPTVTGVGTLLWTYVIPSGYVPIRVGATARDDGFITLKRNTKYLLRFTAGSDATTASIVVGFTERLWVP